ncbi:MAG: zinc ribbon domain-containing protein [Herminiimonas sp.]|nr:zinc ribbon domain-containing protein [Herminiimonas sp.]
MPIYAYRCEACGFAKDVLQKVSDPQLTVCLSCGAASFKKQVTAAGFQLKGTGWYATDFRNGAGTTAPAVPPNAGEAKAGNAEKSGSDNTGAGSDKAASTPAGGGASTGTGTAAAPAAGSGTTPSSAA